jgi:hypothetical protein
VIQYLAIHFTVYRAHLRQLSNVREGRVQHMVNDDVTLCCRSRAPCVIALLQMQCFFKTEPQGGKCNAKALRDDSVMSRVKFMSSYVMLKQFYR